MKKLGLSFLLLLTLNSVAFAQSEPVKVEVENISNEEVEAGEYTVSGTNEVEIDGTSFMQYQLQKKYPTFNYCPPTNSSINLNRGLLVANMAGSMAAAYGVYKVSSHQDKVRHALAGYVVGNVTTGTLQLILPKTLKHRKLYAFIGGFGASVLVGVGKEYRDSKGYGHVDAKDAIATGLGGLGGSLTISFGDIKSAFHKKQKVVL